MPTIQQECLQWTWNLQNESLRLHLPPKPRRFKENFEAEQLALTTDDMDKITELNRDRRYISGSFWAFEGGPFTLENIWDGEE